jgi:hypothetical protein
MGGNGSPEPVFETDDKSYFMVTILAHTTILSKQLTNGAKTLFFKVLEEIIAFSNGASNQALNTFQILFMTKLLKSLKHYLLKKCRRADRSYWCLFLFDES